ncbi:MAG: glycoside hydrolase [Planctomycetes bacterium]|nr:glycoside hydrolase [Planctomycetota bacterium]
MRIPSSFAFFVLVPGLLAQQSRDSQVVSTGVQGVPAGISISSENGDTSAILYRDNFDDSVWVRVADGRGLTWQSPVQLDDDATNSSKRTTKHSLWVDGERIYVAWFDERNGPNDDVYFQASMDGGLTWRSSDKRLDDGFSKGLQDARDFRIGSSGNDIVAVIATEDGIGESLFITWSKDGGLNWENAEAVTNHNGLADVDDIALACSDNLAYIVWRDDALNGVDDSVWLSTFDILNESFISIDVNVSPNLVLQAGDADDAVAVDVDDDYLAILYHADNLGGTAEQVRVNLSSDLGQTWRGDRQVGQYDNVLSNHDADNGTLIVEDGYVGVAWQDDRSGMDEVYCTYADFLTGSFAADVQCSAPGSLPGPPQLSGEFSDEAMAIIWTETPGRVLQGKYLRNGSWSSSFLVSDNIGDVSNARLSWNDPYDNFQVMYLADDSGADQAFVGGFRVHQIDPGVVTAGSSATFALSGFIPGYSFQVVAANSAGVLPLPDGRDLGMAFDTVFQTTMNLSALSGVIGLAGTGSTSPVGVPASFAGRTVYLASVSFDPLGAISDLSDVVSIMVQ